jgi:SAM-dependent methyltransferase
MSTSDPDFRAILGRVDGYYTEKLRAHGATARGVDWNSLDSQALRFAQFLGLLPARESFSINDYGCGYGSLLDYLRDTDRPFRYHGYDVSKEMIATAVARQPAASEHDFTTDESRLAVADYTVASGIFNVKVNLTDTEWTPYVFAVIARLAALSSRGFAFNMLTTHCDADRRQDRLFYADPAQVFEHCRQRFSRHVALLHDYPLYEFTILVKL